MPGRVRVLLATLLLLCSARARAQANAALDSVLVVQPDATACITQRALAARVQHWLKRPPEADVTVRVQADARPLAFTVQHAGVIMAERSFERLPQACPDRLEAVALAVALAI